MTSEYPTVAADTSPPDPVAPDPVEAEPPDPVEPESAEAESPPESVETDTDETVETDETRSPPPADAAPELYEQVSGGRS